MRRKTARINCNNFKFCSLVEVELGGKCNIVEIGYC